MAALYSNENFPLGIVEHLRQLGHDVLTAQEAGNAGRGVPDDEVLRFSTARQRAVITHNRRHFSGLIAKPAASMAASSPAPTILTKPGKPASSTRQ